MSAEPNNHGVWVHGTSSDGVSLSRWFQGIQEAEVYADILENEGVADIRVELPQVRRDP